MAEPIIPPDLREKPRRPVNSNVECPLSCAVKDGFWPTAASTHTCAGFGAWVDDREIGNALRLIKL